MFEYMDDSGDTFAIRESSYGGYFRVSVQCEDDGLPRVADVPRAALLEWLNGGKPEAQTAFVVTDEMAEAACKAAYPESWEDLWGFAEKKNACEDQRRIITAALAAAQVPVWEPCQREEIKKGDRYRCEDVHGASESVAGGDFTTNCHGSPLRWFRIPAPVETAEWPKGKAGDLFRVTYTDSEGVKHEDVLMLLGPSLMDLFCVKGNGYLPELYLRAPDRPATLHKVTRMKAVEA